METIFLSQVDDEEKKLNNKTEMRTQSRSIKNNKLI